MLHIVERAKKALLFRCERDERDGAIGWALREYSKTAPDAVRTFVAEHDDELSALSKREALKVVNRDR